MPVPEEERPRAGRVMLGFLAAAFAAVTTAILLLAISAGDMELESLLGFSIFAFLFGVPIALIAILIMALPAYLLMRRHWHVQWWNAALSGAIVGSVGGSLLGGSDVTGTLQMALAGLVGGLIFWVVVRQRPAALRIDPETFR